jgi:signal transduction histidine kinase
MIGSTLVWGERDGCGVRFAVMTDVTEQRSGVARWQLALLPGGLYEASSGRRSARDWFVDVTMFLLAVGVGLLVLGQVWDDRSGVANVVDVAVGSVACLGLWLRRSRPVRVAVFAVTASAFFAMAGGAGLLAIFNAAIRAPRRALVPLAVLSLAASAVFPLVNPGAGAFLEQLLLGWLLTAVAIGWGLFVRARRELISSLRERAERLESEQRWHVERAREAERRRIAHEMHDVLAHRLSLLSVHAGALEFRPDARAEDVAEAAAVIRATASAALEELRNVIGVLRDDATDAAEPPQPTLAQLPALLEESRAAGMTVRARIAAPAPESLPDPLGRTAYRVIQEGLTNARKHAPDAAVEVTIASDPRAGLVVEVVSRRPVGASVNATLALTGGGTGLIGLAERLALVGGELEHGPDTNGDFIVRATLPWVP